MNCSADSAGPQAPAGTGQARGTRPALQAAMTTPLKSILVCLGLLLAGCGLDLSEGPGTGVSPPPPPADTTAPASPAGVVAMALSDSTIGLSWSASPEASRYHVLRDGLPIGSTSETQLGDTGLAGQTRYCYQVVAADAAGNESARSDSACATTNAPPPRLAGFDFPLEQGDFWAFGWELFEKVNDVTVTDRGMFYVRLGAPRTIGGVAMNAVELYGRSAAMGRYTEQKFAPRWKYLALHGSQLLGSKDGVGTEVVFDAQRGAWSGGGFFAEFRNDRLISARADSIDSVFVKGSALSASTSSSTSQCEYFSGVGTICGGDVDSSATEKDFFREGVGPLGYFAQSFLSSCGGGYCTMHFHKYDVGLLGSSLTHYAFTPQREVEPNDTRASARDFSGSGQVLVGDVHSSDAATVTTLASLGYTNARLHDFFTVNHAGGAMSAELSFEAHLDADLDLFIFDASNNLVASSIDDNVQKNDFHELVRQTLPAGRYTVAVGGYVTPSRVTWNFQWH